MDIREYIAKRTNLYKNEAHIILPDDSSLADAVESFVKSSTVPYHKNNNTFIIKGVSNVIDFTKHVYDDQTFITSLWNTLQVPVVMEPITVVIVDAKAVIPSKAHASDIGYDLSVIAKVKDLTYNTALYDTGIKMMAPAGYYLEIHPRSSISKSGYILANSTGIIDPGYTGNLYVALTKIDPNAPEITFPAKMAQVIVRKAYFSVLKVENTIDTTTRNVGGFGSTN
jgi:deoxyuridine 5'-triphosphate nucleotidohydrolase